MCALLLLASVLASCSSEEKKVTLPKSKGLPCELLVITDKAVSESDVMDSINALTQTCVPEIMQPEPMFKVVRVSEQNYTRRYVTLHTKLRVHLNSRQTRPMMGVSHDDYATPQTEVTVAAADVDELRLFLARHKQEIVDALLDGQLQRMAYDLRRQHNDNVYKAAVSHLGVSICVPKCVCAVKRGHCFLWAGSNLQERDQNVVLYEYPWDGSALDDMNRYVAMRDSVMKANIPGENPGQWMHTSQMDGMPVVIPRIRHLQGRDCVVVRGMWDVSNAPLGGPFVSIATIDSMQRMVRVAEGFVYSPSTEKRDLLRQLEASLLTIKKQR